ncbi:MAG: NlpC/P60 family protein [Lysinibacillus sp.]
MKKRNNWRKSVVLTFALTGGLLFSTVQPLQANAEETSQEMINKKAQIDADVKKLETELATLQKDMDTKIKAFNKVREDIGTVDHSIVETEERIEKRTELLGDRLAAYQARDSNFNLYLNVMLESKSITDLVDRVVAVKTIVDADQELIDEQAADKESLKTQKTDLAIKQKELEKQFQELQQKEGEMELKKAESEAKSLALKAQIATKQDEERLEAARKAAEEEAAQLRALQNTAPVGQQATNNKGEQSPAVTPGSGSGTSAASTAIASGKQFLGRPYVWGGSNPSTGFDCSGFVQWNYKQAGVSLPRTSSQQYLATTRISASEARVGDLVFFSYGSGVAHVGIYMGNNTMINAQNSGVKIESLDWWNKYLVGFGRIK